MNNREMYQAGYQQGYKDALEENTEWGELAYEKSYKEGQNMVICALRYSINKLISSMDESEITVSDLAWHSALSSTLDVLESM